MLARFRTPALAVPARKLVLERHPLQPTTRITRKPRVAPPVQLPPAGAPGDSVAVCFRRPPDR